ncbi:hypothetical protein EVAR_6418_1 [Eumeta japonica]|uniref:Uncharacterized protein n=1 Tax=Eumeta variegata TaxID=151549 RepID=A0A4C1TFM1_EUMVA|nr:hypothetical protein EVAR_6418_1 [Eumeta japonica]
MLIIKTEPLIKAKLFKKHMIWTTGWVKVSSKDWTPPIPIGSPLDSILCYLTPIWVGGSFQLVFPSYQRSASESYTL